MRPSPPRGSRRHYYRRLWWIVGILLVVFASVSVQLFNSFQQTTTTAINEASTNENNQIPVLLRTTVSSKKNYQWAYVFLMAGCDAQAPLTYRNYLYNILVASKLIRQGGSQADIIVMVQFSKQSSSLINSTMTLSNSDLQWLKLFQIKVHYLPPPIRDNFYNAQLSKFRILELTQYSRVLYLDADVLPLCSLDYLLDLSSNGVLQPNLILAWFTEPAHGGLFVLEPGNYEEWQGILNRREQQALQLPYPHWDPVVGWGTNPLQEEWRGIPNGDEGTPARHSLNWTFHGDFADQGLLYYWTRFYHSQVSIIFLDEIENWKNDQLVQTYKSLELLGNRTCLPKGMEYPGQYGSTLEHRTLLQTKIPHRDFVHFSGDSKPWEQRRESENVPKSMADVNSSTDYWYYQLKLIFEEFQKKFPNRKLPSFPLKHKPPSLGRYPTLRSMIGTIAKKQRKQQQQVAS